MTSIQSKEAVEQRSIAGLAKEFALPVEEVLVLYEAHRTLSMRGVRGGK